MMELTFDQASKRFGFKLSETARDNHSWWDNWAGQPWIKAGWQVYHLDMYREKVTFKQRPSYVIQKTQ